MAFFFPEEDLALLDGVKAELYDRAYPAIRVYYPDLETENYDPLYGEAAEEAKQTDTFFDIPAYYKIGPLRKQYSKFGIEDRRDLLLVFSTQILDRGYAITTEPPAGVFVEEVQAVPGRRPFPYPGFGCTFEVEGEFYVTTNVMRDDYFGNTSRYTSWVVLGNKARLSSMRGRELDDVFTAPRDGVPGLTLPAEAGGGVVVGPVPVGREPLVSRRSG